VKKGEALLEVETDKINVDMESPDDGSLQEVRAREGEFVKFGATIAVVEKEN
jgi:pyruvate/2-oxoglutarate dehydrogenase complex dihydrolipoamide acyltransferase (E2) component